MRTWTLKHAFENTIKVEGPGVPITRPIKVIELEPILDILNTLCGGATNGRELSEAQVKGEQILRENGRL